MEELAEEWSHAKKVKEKRNALETAAGGQVHAESTGGELSALGGIMEFRVRRFPMEFEFVLPRYKNKQTNCHGSRSAACWTVITRRGIV